MKKEELRRYREAREGLSPEEVAELDRRGREEQAFEKEVQLWHGRIFREEDDFYFDSGADARDRARGINPMSERYIRRTDARRRALGFAGYMDKEPDLPSDTRGWVREMQRDGRREELETAYARVVVEEEAPREIHPADAPEDVQRALDEWLEHDTSLLPRGLTQPAEILAFQIFSFLISRHRDHARPEAADLLRTKMPDLDEKEVARAIDAAQNSWCDIYE